MMNVKAICEPTNDNEVFYSIRKYAGAWVPVVKVNGKRKTFAHCATSGGAMEIAHREAIKAAGAEV